VHVAKITQLKHAPIIIFAKSTSSKSARKAGRHRSQNNIKMNLAKIHTKVLTVFKRSRTESCAVILCIKRKTGD
jgi:hypothetical protein